MIKDIQTCFLDLDEESKIPKGSSGKWFEKLTRQCHVSGGRGGNRPGDGELKFNKITVPAHKNSFTVAHYAGDVSYVPAMFLEKNKEQLSDSLIGLMAQSQSTVVQALFEIQEAQEVGKAQKTVKSISWNFTAS